MPNLAYQTIPDQEHPSHGLWIETVSGRVIDLVQPSPSQIEISDIAWALSRANRFAGNTCGRTPYSVACHSVWVADYVFDQTRSAEIALHALLHDAAEAYMGDIPRPLKKLVPEVHEVEQRLLSAIYEALYLEQPDSVVQGIIERADEQALMREAETFMVSRGVGWPQVQLTRLARCSPKPMAVNSEKAATLFYRNFRRLNEEVNQ